MLRKRAECCTAKWLRLGACQASMVTVALFLATESKAVLLFALVAAAAMRVLCFRQHCEVSAAEV
jgi:hypothetical protein